jgi:hypothetical protein
VEERNKENIKEREEGGNRGINSGSVVSSEVL